MGGRAQHDGRGAILFSARWIPEKPDHGRLFYSLNYGITEHLSAGVDYRPISEDWGINGSFRLLEEQENRPAVILATATDDFDNVTSQSYSAVAAKRLFDWNGITVAPYLGGVYIDKLDEFRPVGGLYLRSTTNFSVLAMYSGKDPHLTVSYAIGSVGISAILFDLEDVKPGIGITTSF